MRNNKFWDECNQGSIREKVAQFLDKTPLLSSFKNEEYYTIEDAIVNFIEENRDMIAAEVDKEYQRDDLVNRASIDYGDEAAHIIAVMPIKQIDSIITWWQELLNNSDIYWDETWSSLSDTLDEVPALHNLCDYERDDVFAYVAYLQEWYKSHDTIHESPVCIDEFFNREMADKEYAEYFRKLAIKFKAEHGIED